MSGITQNNVRQADAQGINNRVTSILGHENPANGRAFLTRFGGDLSLNLLDKRSEFGSTILGVWAEY